MPLWTPSPARRAESPLTAYLAWLAREKGLRFDGYDALWRWSVAEPEAFWESVWQHFEVRASRPYTSVLAARRMPGARWFEGARLNLAENCFRHAAADRPALVFASEIAPLAEVSWDELAHEVGRVAGALRGMGVKPGDRVAAFVPNIPQAIVAFLACASLGAVWSSCAPDMGAASILDRFRQIDPKVLIAVDGYRYGGKDFDRRGVVEELRAKLPTLEHVVLIPYLLAEATLPGATGWKELKGKQLQFEQLPFDHPLWIVYSSGTSGPPKPIVHGHGGMLMNTLKSLAFEFDLRRGDRFFWYTSSGWIMWNLLASSLVGGCSAVLMDGHPGFPDPGRLWRFAAEAKADFVGTSPAFVGVCMKAGIEPARLADLSHMRSLGCSGSPLSGDAYRWIYRQFPDVFLAVGCGGTDVAGGIVGSSPALPIHEGEMQCRLLGVDVDACDPDGRPLAGEIGEMMIGTPLPSMPLHFWNDAGGRRYHDSYFSMAPGKWRQGDWLRITPRGGAVVYGRSDATIKRHGVRLGTSELYRAIEGVPEVLDSLVIDLEYLDRPSYMPLFVQLRPGMTLDAALKARIADAIRTGVSARFVPDDIFAVAEVPRTLTGKKMELPVRNLLLGRPLDKVASRDAMANPASLDYFVAFAAERAAAA